MVDLGQDREPASTQLGNPGASGSEDLVLRAQARVGSTLRGKWHLDTLIGLGGSAAVYAATHRNGSRAAVKVLHPELALVPWVRHRFLREGYVANAVGHPAVVKVLDDDIAEDGAPYLVTELLEGEVLEERRLRLGGRIPQGDVLSIADELLDVLAAAHAQGVVHRDIKPENVFVTRSGRIKVLDFGIARLRDAPADANRTQAGLTMGTPAYMAPEQALGRWDEVDGLSDIWAVGATMFQLLAGRDVHAGATVNEQLLSAMTKPAPALSSAASDVSPEVANLVDRALAFDKGDRWPDARAMQLELRRVSSARSGQAPLPALAVADGHRASRSEEAARARSAFEHPCSRPCEKHPRASAADAIVAPGRIRRDGTRARHGRGRRASTGGWRRRCRRSCL